MSTDLVEADNRDVAGPERVNELHALVIEEWSAMNAFIEGARKKAQGRRIKLGYLLLELQQRIEAGENGDLCRFWPWFKEMIPHSRSDAEQLMAIARQADPEAAYQKRLEKQSEARERHYQKKFGVPRSNVEVEPEPSPRSNVGAEPEPLPPAPKPKPRYPTAPDDDSNIEQILDLVRRLSWDGLRQLVSRLSQLYRDWQRGNR